MKIHSTMPLSTIQTKTYMQCIFELNRKKTILKIQHLYIKCFANRARLEFSEYFMTLFQLIISTKCIFTYDSFNLVSTIKDYRGIVELTLIDSFVCLFLSKKNLFF